MPDYSLRQAQPQDAEVLALLARITFREAFGHVWQPESLGPYLDTTFSVEKLRSSLAKANNRFWIAYRDGFPAGYLKLKLFSPYEKLTDPAPAQLQKIYVLRDFMGEGIGENLLQACTALLRQQGSVRTLWLACWDGNPDAIRFYERCGFQKTTRYRYDFGSSGFDYDVLTLPIDGCVPQA